MAKRWLIIVVAVAFLLGIACCGVPYSIYRYTIELPIHNFQRLIAKDDQIEVASIVIHGQGLVVNLDDSESAAYFTAAFRDASHDAYMPRCSGTTYTLDLRFNTGGSISLHTFISAACDGFDVGYFDDGLGLGDPIYHWIPLKKPIPEAIAKAFKQLEQVGRAKH